VMPPIGLLLSGVDFSKLAWVLKPDDPATAANEQVAVQYGALNPPKWFAYPAAALIVLSYVGVLFAGAAGIWLAPPRWREHVLLLLPIVFITAIHTIVYGHSRYHMPLMPLLGVYAAGLFERGRAAVWPPRGIAWYATALTVLLLLAIWLRQFVFADAGRIRALFGHGGS